MGNTQKMLALQQRWGHVLFVVCATMMPYFDNASLTAFAKRGEAIYMRVTDLPCIQASELLLKKRRKKSLMSFVPLSYKLLSRGSDFVSLSSC